MENFSNYKIMPNGEIYIIRQKIVTPYINGEKNIKNIPIYKEVNKRIKQNLCKNGYMRVTLVSDDGKKKTFLSHRLVAEEYIDNVESKPCVNHIDGNKTNNDVSNLEWVTHSENTNHAYENNLLSGRKGQLHPLSKLTEETAMMLCLDTLKGYSLKELSEIYGVTPKYISLIKNKKKWKHLWERIPV